jgi:hypothetical protein
MVAHGLHDTLPPVIVRTPRITCTQCRSSEPLFAMSGGNDGVLAMGIRKKGNHFHMVGMWMGLYNTPTAGSSGATTLES